MNTSASTLRTLTAVYVALMALLVLTCAVAFVDIGGWNVVANLGIGALKTLLVVLYFMELRSAAGLLRLAAAIGLLWLLLLFALTFGDYLTRFGVPTP